MDKHADLMESIGKGLGSVRDTVTDPKVLPYLLSGGAGAAAGGFLTSRTPERPGEDRGSRRKRILRNAALLGAGTAGAHKLINDGLPGITAPKPPGGPTAPQAALEGVSKNPAYYGVAGGTLAGLVARMSGKEEAKNTGSVLRNLDPKNFKDIDPSKVNTRNLLMNKIKELTQGGNPLKTPGGARVTNTDLRGAGINADKVMNAGPRLNWAAIKSILPDVLGRGVGDPDLGNSQAARGLLKSHLSTVARGAVTGEGAKLFRDRVTGMNRGGGAVAKRLGLLGLLGGVIPQGISRATRAYDPEAFVE